MDKTILEKYISSAKYSLDIGADFTVPWFEMENFLEILACHEQLAEAQAEVERLREELARWRVPPRRVT